MFKEKFINEAKKINKLPKKYDEVFKSSFILYEDDNVSIEVEMDNCAPIVNVYRQNIDWRDSKNSKRKFEDSMKPWNCSAKAIEDAGNKMIKKYGNKGPSYKTYGDA